MNKMLVDLLSLFEEQCASMEQDLRLHLLL